MCGIIGLVSFNEKDFASKRDFFIQGLVATSLRGTDGTGYFMVPHDLKKDTPLIKKAIPSFDFVQTDIVKRTLGDIEKYKFVVGHCRAKTRGEVIASHTHPFHFDNICLVHNGSITNSYQLANNSYLPVDSMSIALALSKNEDRVEVLKQIEGAFALVWYDFKTDSLYLTRNSQRPLFFGIDKTMETVAFASEQGLLEWIGSRNGMVFNKVYDVGEHQLVTFKDNLDFNVEKYVVPTKTYNYGRSPAVGGMNENFTMGSSAGQDVIEHPRREGRKLYGQVAIPQLREIGLKLRDTINITSVCWRVKSTRSRHGTLEAMWDEHPYSDVVSFGVPIFPSEDNSIYKAVVMGIERFNDKDFAIIVAANIEKVEDTPKSNLILLPNKSDSSEALTETGPSGYVTRSTFLELAKDGCAFCNTPVFDSFKIRWTHDNRPVCPTCVGELNKEGNTGALVQ